MPMTLTVMYPQGDGLSFDYDYYLGTHMPLVGEHMGAHFTSATASKGLAGGPDTPPGFFTVATLTCADPEAFDAMMAAASPVVADIANFYNGAPQMLIGEVIS